MGVLENIREQYPTLSFLVDHPEIGPLLRDAVDPNKGFSPQTFQAKLYQTNWWKSQSNTQREWLIKTQTDPGSARQEAAIMQAQIRQMAAKLGVTVSSNEVLWMSNYALGTGQAADSQYVIDGILGIRRNNPGRTTAGAVKTTAEQMKQMALSQYFKALPAHSAGKWAEWVTSGKKSMEDFQTSLHAEATKRFPHMRRMLAEGNTVADIIDPLRAVIAEEMEYGDVSRVNVSRGPWRQLLGVRDPKSKQMRMLTEAEVVRLARSRPEWWKTSRGQEADAGMASTLMSVFGARKGLAS